jgi:hypothetical protein
VNSKCSNSRFHIDSFIIDSNPILHIDNADENLAFGERLRQDIIQSQAPHLAKVEQELLDADTRYKASHKTDQKSKVII